MLILYTAMIDDEADQLRFADIYYGYRKQMLLTARRILGNDEDAEDAVQTALLGIARRIKAVPSDDSGKLRAYVLTAAKNAALSMLPQKTRRETDVELDSLPLAAEDDLFTQVSLSQDYNLLLHAMRLLPPPYREVLLMVCVEEQSIRDTAALLHRRPGTVRQQLNRGKRLLVELCRKEGMHFE